MPKSLKRILALRIENQHRHCRVIHEELVDEAIIHPPGKVPQPDIALYAGFLLVVTQRPMRRPRAVSGRQQFVVLDLETVGEVVAKPRLAHAALTDEEDFGVCVLNLFRRRRWHLLEVE